MIVNLYILVITHCPYTFQKTIDHGKYCMYLSKYPHNLPSPLCPFRKFSCNCHKNFQLNVLKSKNYIYQRSKNWGHLNTKTKENTQLIWRYNEVINYHNNIQIAYHCAYLEGRYYIVCIALKMTRLQKNK